MSMSISKSSIRTQFFDRLLADSKGFLCVATTHGDVPKSTFKQHFFSWPEDLFKMEEFFTKNETKHNIYFCPHLLSKTERKKEYCLSTDLLWADLDEVNPSDTDNEILSKLQPPIVIQTSPGRFQAFWRLEEKIKPYEAEMFSRRLAYAIGADPSGWDLGQLFRVPYTFNFKYKGNPPIILERVLEVKAPLTIFDNLPMLEEESDGVSEMPSEFPELEKTLEKYLSPIKGTDEYRIFTEKYSRELGREDNWSDYLWGFIHSCIDLGMNEAETLVITWNSSINKYKRDGRPVKDLWHDVDKAFNQRKRAKLHLVKGDHPIVKIPEMANEPASGTFLDVYMDWASEATDAVTVFHELCCFVMLSAIVSNSVRITTSYGIVRPNIWGLILGDTTLTRKTTAMNMATQFITRINHDMIVATDGTAEGLLTGLAMRPNKTSIFHRDEFSGFLEALKKKDYLAGMIETLTNLYDVPPYMTRRLRKEVITIEAPSFIFLAGGVRDRVYGILEDQDVISGFIPRFLVVSGDTDLDSLRPTSAGSKENTEKQSVIQAFTANLYETYASDVTMRVGGEKVLVPPKIEAVLTKDAWEKYQKIERDMLEAAFDSTISELALPTYERYSRSILKMSPILAACRQEPKEGIISVSVDDIVNAAYYGQRWLPHAIDLIAKASKSIEEKKIEKTLVLIWRHPNGIRRSDIMNTLRLNKREMDNIIETLKERDQIGEVKRGKTRWYHPLI
jgi:hypothetical protein